MLLSSLWRKHSSNHQMHGLIDLRTVLNTMKNHNTYFTTELHQNQIGFNCLHYAYVINVCNGYFEPNNEIHSSSALPIGV
jgi:hypothetical protein